MHTTRIGLLFLLCSAFTFSLVGHLIRIVSNSTDFEIIVFIRNLAGVFFIIFLNIRKRNLFRTNVFRLHLLRGALGTSAMYALFYSFIHLPLSKAALFTYSAPIFIPVFSKIWLGESTTRKSYVAIIIGFLGLLLIIRPGKEFVDFAALVGVSSTILAAMAFVSVRKLASTEPSYQIVLYFSCFATIVSFFPAIFADWNFSSSHLFLMTLIGVMATSAQFFLAKAYSFASPAKISPVGYSSVLFAGFLGWLYWGETPDLFFIGGAVLIFAAGVLTLKS